MNRHSFLLLDYVMPKHFSFTIKRYSMIYYFKHLFSTCLHLEANAPKFKSKESGNTSTEKAQFKKFEKKLNMFQQFDRGIIEG